MTEEYKQELHKAMKELEEELEKLRQVRRDTRKKYPELFGDKPTITKKKKWYQFWK